MLPRDQVLLCTKGGYLPFDGRRPHDMHGREMRVMAPRQAHREVESLVAPGIPSRYRGIALR